MGMLDFLYGGPSTELSPVQDPNAQFPGMLSRMFTVPGWANQALQDYAGPQVTGKTLRRAVTPPGWLSDLSLNPLDPNQMGAAVPSATSGLGRGAPTGPPVPMMRPGGNEPLPPGTPGVGAGEAVMTPPNTAFDPTRMQPGPSGVPSTGLDPGTPAPAMPAPTTIPAPPPVGVVPKQDNFPAGANAPRPNPITQLPQASAGVLDRINDYLKRNSNMLIGLGAGFAGAPSFGQGVSRAGYGALAGGKLDVSEQQRMATVSALMAQGYTREQAEAMAGDKGLLKTENLPVGPPGRQENVPVSMSPFGVRPLPVNLGAQGAGAPDGATKQINGRTYVVVNGKWHEAT
jgi:hypothetical protein